MEAAMGEVNLDAIERECWPTPAGDASIVVVKSGELRALIRLARIGKAVVDSGDVLKDFIRAVEIEANEKGAGGYLFARLSDAREFLSELAKAASPGES
jgi:hypothetical protein